MAFHGRRGRAGVTLCSLTPSSWQGPARAFSIPPRAVGQHRLGSTGPSSPPPEIQDLLQNLSTTTWHHTYLKPWQHLSTHGKILPCSAPRTTLNATSSLSLQLLQTKKSHPHVLNLIHKELAWHLQLLASLGSSTCSRTALLGSWLHSKSVIHSPSRSTTSPAERFQTPTSGSVI